MRFSTASTTPSEVLTPMAVEPSCGQDEAGLKPVTASATYCLYCNSQVRTQAIDSSEQNGSVQLIALRRFVFDAHLNCFDGVFDLKQSPLWTKCIHATVVLRPGEKHLDTAEIGVTERACLPLLGRCSLQTVQRRLCTKQLLL